MKLKTIVTKYTNILISYKIYKYFNFNTHYLSSTVHNARFNKKLSITLFLASVSCNKSFIMTPEINAENIHVCKNKEENKDKNIRQIFKEIKEMIYSRK